MVYSTDPFCVYIFFFTHLQSQIPKVSKIDCLRFVMCPQLVPVLKGFFSFFPLRPLTVLMKQTRQVVHKVKQSILLRCLCLQSINIDYFLQFIILLTLFFMKLPKILLSYVCRMNCFHSFKKLTLYNLLFALPETLVGYEPTIFGL